MSSFLEHDGPTAFVLCFTTITLPFVFAPDFLFGKNECDEGMLVSLLLCPLPIFQLYTEFQN